MQITPYHAKLFAYELTRKRAANDLGKFTATLQDARVDMNPHQVEAALFAFKSPLSKGAILADEVGLGKTIEAGIILSQLWAEKKRKILIISPANLRKQWNQELQDKFYLPSKILESKAFKNELDSGVKNPYNQNEIVLCSFQFARSKEAFVSAVDWDLVVIDEAHRLRNVYRTDNKIGKAIKKALDGKKKILLTATPLQNSILELYGLVSIVDDYVFGDLKSFKSQYGRMVDQGNFLELKKRLEPVCLRTLRRQVLEYISYTNRLALVEQYIPYDNEQELYDDLSDYLSTDQLYALPASQRHLMTLILRKLMASSTFAIQGTLEGLANKLEILLQRSEAFDSHFLESDFETLDEEMDEWEMNDDSNDFIELNDFDKVAIRKEIEVLQSLAQKARKIKKNAKGDKLVVALEKGFEKLEELGANEKAIIFTESTRTQSYIKKILEKNGYKGKLVLFNGTNNDEDSKKIYQNWLKKHKDTDRITGAKSADMRQAIVDQFREKSTIMIATEAAAEGINLQFCSLIINYDLPWNPQRIEQRIGRCHRYGQKYDVVVINFLNQLNHADQRVYQLLDEKFQLFNGVFGASDEVLGAIESGVDFEKRIAKIYQECRTPDEIKTAFDLLDKEFEEQKLSKIDQTKIQLIENFDEDVTKKLKINLEKGLNYLNQFEDWLWKLTKYELSEIADFDDAKHVFELNKTPEYLQGVKKGSYKFVTQDTSKRQEEDIEGRQLYRARHPLAQVIIDKHKDHSLGVRSLVFDYSNSEKKVTDLETLVGSEGFLRVSCLSIKSFEEEEFLLFSGHDDSLSSIDPTILSKLFTLPASDEENLLLSVDQKKNLDDIESGLVNELLHLNLEKNTIFFDQEYEKLDHWADDMKISLEKEINDLDAEIKLKKSEVRKVTELMKKVGIQRDIKDLEKKRNEKRKRLFEAQDEIDNKKEDLLNKIEEGLKQEIKNTELFTIHWKLI